MYTVKFFHTLQRRVLFLMVALFLLDSRSEALGKVMTNGTVINSFSPAGIDTLIGDIDILPNGNLAVLDTGMDLLLEFQTDGNPTNATDLSGGSRSGNAVMLNANIGTFFVSDDGNGSGQFFGYDTGGGLLNTIDTSVFGVLEPEGIHFDPIKGDLFFVDDETDQFYELSETGNLLDRIDLAPLFGFITPDPEGLDYDPVTQTLYVAFKNNEVVASFSYEPSAIVISDDLDSDGNIDRDDLNILLNY